MELRHLRYFVAVAEALSFTAAAARLGLSQPPLSQQIQDLEQELQTRLLRRNSRKVELTDAGEAFLGQARAILAQAEEAAGQARAIGQGRRGRLDIALTGSVLLGPLAPLVAGFEARFPEVEVRLHEMPPQEQQEALHARRVDLSFQRWPREDDALVAERAWAEGVCVALRDDHPLAARGGLRLAELREERLVFLRLRDSRFAAYLRDACIAAGFTPRISQQVVEAHSLPSLVAAGFGIALVPESVTLLSRQGVLYRPLAEAPLVADVQMIRRPDHSAVTARFLDFARVFLAGQRQGR
jgi:DNA-binding transcriptional LysR family regulator